MYISIYLSTSDCLSREADANKHEVNPRCDPHGVWFCGHVCDVIYIYTHLLTLYI